VSTVRKFILDFGIILLAILIHPAAAVAQSCAALPGDGSLLSYRFRANVPRCEGMYRSPVAGYPGMTLVSLTYGRVTYNASQDQYLEIKLALAPVETTLIRAVGIPERLYYRLDAELRQGQNGLRLPLVDVVAAERIPPKDFGIYGVKKLPGSQDAYIPVYARGSGAASQEEIVAVVRPGADVTDVLWRSYAPNVPPRAWAPVTGASGLVPEGTRLEILLAKNMPPRMTLEVSFRSNGIDRADRFVLLDR
jgi:hypothetical protein